MKESATTALTYLQANAKKYNIDPYYFQKEMFMCMCPKVQCLRMGQALELQCLHRLRQHSQAAK
jgi:hypothetical protein